MSYRVKEMIYTLQGEGANTGAAVVLCRFEGCNLDCSFCDTDYAGINGPSGGEFSTAASLVEAACQCWQGDDHSRKILCTGGEPLLQLDSELVNTLHERGFEILLETNGTLAAPDGIDWICVSPKAGEDPVIRKGNELKLAYPQEGIDPEKYSNLDFRYYYIQPISGVNLKKNIRLAIEYCLKHPRWRLSLQLHKYTGIP
ncbi:MAG: 7-carboxy-7-deazaguanine synthase [Candidatus Fermentibacteraceae bacterium]|nr:7-carboxy-7-deazaguanine synthase [Candidatus Fermentibacteraceae bacterium]